MNDDIRKQIFLKLIHTKEAKFSELWDKSVESNAFTYHLKKLEQDGLIEKKGDAYSLTFKGRQESAFIEGDSGERALMPTLTVVVMVKDNNRVLVQKRLKEPFYGYHGFISGKINFGLNVLECAARDLFEETSLNADFELKGFTMTKTFDDDRLAFHHFFYFVVATNPRGVLKTKSHKEENFWVNIEDIDKIENKFPDFDKYRVLDMEGRFFIREVERYQKDGKFIDYKVLSQRFL